MKKILLAGESWMSYTTHVKGFDPFYTSLYETGDKQLCAGLRQAGFEVDVMPSHIAAEQFPFEMETLAQYHCVILSDIGSNTLLLPHKTFSQSMRMPNRCALIKEYVLKGGSLLMVGGYLTFSGIDGKGRWGQTPVQDVLPVSISHYDDRAEHCEGVTPVVTNPKHPALSAIPSDWPFLLGYNKTSLLPGAEIAATICGDPLIAFGRYGKGKSGVFTSDCSPHWCPPEFMNWQGYAPLWSGLVNHLTSI